MVRHGSLKRKIKRIGEELKSTFEIAKYTNIRKGIATFFAKAEIQKINKSGGVETIKATKRLLQKHDIILEYLEKKYQAFFNAYDYSAPIPSCNIAKRYVWVLWWQGYDNAPDIVKICIDSIKKHCLGAEFIIICKDNYKLYAELPDWIEEKREKGIISLTHYSDLLRMELLAKYGGIWLDSTFLCTSDIESLFLLPVWSVKRPGYGHLSVACGNFANYSLGCSYEHRRVYATIRDFILQWWQDNDYIVDYLLTDYLIVLAQKYDPYIKKMFDSIPPNNPNCDELLNNFGKPYDKVLWSRWIEDTCLFKLTWKTVYAEENDTKETFYARFINRKL